MAETKTTDTTSTTTDTSTSTTKPVVDSKTVVITISARDAKIRNIAGIGSTIGMIAGLVTAFNGRKQFWTYVGYAIVGSIVIGASSGLIARAVIKKDK
jgi:hypothetical protein